MSERREQQEKTPWSEIFVQFRGRLSVMIALVGLSMFLMQMMTPGRTARPDQAFTLLLFQDYSARNAFLSQQEETADIDPLDVPSVDDHYRGLDLEGFQERFKAYSETLPEHEGLSLIPIRVHFSVPRSMPEDRPLAYWLMQMTPDHARLLMPGAVPTDQIRPGSQFIGPHPYRALPGEDELQEAVDGQSMDPTPHKLPAQASALQGFVIQVVESFDANAYAILPSGTMSVGDYAVNVSEFSDEMATAFQAVVDAGETPDMVPSFRFSDIRHGGFIYAVTLAGQLIFMIGGFLFLYHLIEGYANRDHSEGNFLKNTIVATCRLIRDYRRIYAVSILLFLLFWGYGMLEAYLNPAAQEEMIITYQTVFSGTSWPLGFTAQSYRQGDVLMATIMTFFVNFFWGTVVILTLFSMLPIGSAFIINALRGQAIGLVLAPTKAFMGLQMVPHLLTVVLELQAYLIAGFVSILLPLAMIRPRQFGCETATEAFRKFVFWQLRVLPLIALILLIAAAYEAFELIFLAHIF